MFLSRKEILENHHNSATGQVLEHEINIRKIDSMMIDTPPGKTYESFQEAVVAKQGAIEDIKKVLSIIETMIAEEEKNEQKV